MISLFTFTTFSDLWSNPLNSLNIFVLRGCSEVKAMQKTWVRSLGQEDPLEKEMAPPPNTLAWKIPWTEKPGRLQSMGLQRVRHD